MIKHCVYIYIYVYVIYTHQQTYVIYEKSFFLIQKKNLENNPHHLRHVFDIDVICAYSYLFRILK